MSFLMLFECIMNTTVLSPATTLAPAVKYFLLDLFMCSLYQIKHMLKFVQKQFVVVDCYFSIMTYKLLLNLWLRMFIGLKILAKHTFAIYTHCTKCSKVILVD